MQTDEYLTNAVMFGKVIRCTESNGRVVEFVYTEAEVWVRMYASEEVGHTCTEPAVRNAVDLCQPDVELVDEDVSLFAAARSAEEREVVR